MRDRVAQVISLQALTYIIQKEYVPDEEIVLDYRIDLYRGVIER